jgi:hypothetical protein
MPTSTGADQYTGLARHRSGSRKYHNATFIEVDGTRVRKLLKREIREWIDGMRAIEERRNGIKKQSALIGRRAVV